MRTSLTATLLGGVMLLATSLGAAAVAGDRVERDSYSIMTPEPWVAPKYRSPRGLPQQPKAARPRPPRPPSVDIAKPAPPIVLPNGQVVPNLPPVRQGIVPDGSRETFGDRAHRCAHQSSAFGVPGDQRSTYMHSCTMQ
jgi:hypothetical protein